MALPRHLAYNALPDRYDPTRSTTASQLADMGDILSSPVSSYNGDGEPCCETSDIKEEACTCTSKWLSQTRLRIIALTDANEALTLDSQQAHARIKQLEDQYQGGGRYSTSGNYQGNYQKQSNVSANNTGNANNATAVNEQVRAALETTQQVKREAHQAAAAANARIAHLSQQLRAAVESSEQLKREAAMANNRVAQLNDALMRSRNNQQFLPGTNRPLPHVHNQQFPPFDDGGEEYPDFPGFIPLPGAFHQHVGQLEQSHEALTAQLRDAVRHTDELKQAAHRDAVNSGAQLTALRRANIAQDVRLAQLSEKHARLLADFAILGNQLDMARGAHPPHAIRGLHAELNEHSAGGRDAHMRVGHLSRANAALDLALRNGSHRMEREFGMRNARDAHLVEENQLAEEEMHHLRAENQALGEEVVHRRHREAHAGAGMGEEMYHLRRENQALGEEVLRRRHREAHGDAAIGEELEHLERENRDLGAEVIHRRQREAATGNAMGGRNAQLSHVLDSTRRQMMVMSEANALKDAREARLVEVNERANEELNRISMDNRALTSQYRSARETAAAAMHQVRGARARQNEMANELDGARRRVMELSEARRNDSEQMSERANAQLSNTESNHRALASELSSARSRADAFNHAREAEFAHVNERTKAELDFTRTECENAREREAAAMDEVTEARAVQDEMTHQLDATRRRVMVLSEANAVKNARETHLVEMNERANQHVSNLETDNRVLTSQRQREAVAMDEARLRNLEQQNMLDATRRQVAVLSDANAAKTARNHRYIEIGERAKEELANLQTDFRVLSSDMASGRAREYAAVDEAMESRYKHTELSKLLQAAQRRVANLTRTNAAARERVAYLENVVQEKERLLQEWEASDEENDVSNSDSEYGSETESELEEAEWEAEQANERSIRFESLTRETAGELQNLRAAYGALNAECVRRRTAENSALEEAAELSDLLEATRRRVRALNAANENLASDSAAAHARVTVLERTLDEKEQAVSEWEAQNKEVSEVRQALEKSQADAENATRRCTSLEELKAELRADNARLESELGTANNDKNSAAERAAHLTRSREHVSGQLRAAVRRTDELKHALQYATASAAAQLTALRRNNSELDVRHAGLCERHARLLANHAILGNELDIARAHARAMRAPVNVIAGAPSIAVRALRAELQLTAAQARESALRERSLAAANAALDLAARAEAHRAEMEHTLKHTRENEWRMHSSRAQVELDALKADYRLLTSECLNTQEREAIARDEAATARATMDSLSKANSQLSTEIRTIAERVRAAEIERNVMQSTAQRVGALTSVVARLRARCAELVRRIPDEGNLISARLNMEEEEEEEEETVCVIDMEVIQRGDRVLALPCGHVFHADCILPYLEAMEPANRRCPLDRAVIEVPLDQLAQWNWGENNSSSEFASNVATASTTIEDSITGALGVATLGIGTDTTDDLEGEEEESSTNESTVATAI